MKRPTLFILLLSGMLVVDSAKTNAQLWKQRRIEAIVAVGPSQFFGDIGGFSPKENILGLRDLSFLQTRINLNGSLRYRILSDLSVRLSLTAAMLKATDERGSNENRNMEASTSLIEPAVIGEFYFIKNKTENSYLFSKGQLNKLRSIMNSLDFYTFTGLGGAIYSVNGNDRLNQSGMKDGGFTTVIPIGVGSTIIFSPDINLGIEIGGRYSFSDYLEGYASQYSSSNDVYYFLNFTFIYKLKTKSNGMPDFIKR
ncbi:MAG TPA: hypothetical protein VK213_10055 [Bacteroidales bacterium]|nr:hypothetical protein [Bacteroidales bacterium]